MCRAERNERRQRGALGGRRRPLETLSQNCDQPRWLAQDIPCSDSPSSYGYSIIIALLFYTGIPW
eukprot:3537000-Pyramimonas_sp.AAC.1